MKKIVKPIIWLSSLVAGAAVCMGIAHGIQTDFGNVEVEMGHFEQEDTGKALTYKLYRPKTATEENKAPAILLLHGYQNDHETSAAYAIELARRGFVCLALDEYGHGATEVSMIERGYVNHKTNFTYGTQNKDGKYVVQIGGQTRYKVLMNFSGLDFFNDMFTKDGKFDASKNYLGVDEESANAIKDSSMGGTAAYSYLATLPFVDANYMGITGHSMGTWASWSVAAACSGGIDVAEEGKTVHYPQPKATVLQCGELFARSAYSEHPEITFSNVLLLTAKYDEFNYFRDYQTTPVTEDLIKSDLRVEFLNNENGGVSNGVSAENAEWNKTFGDLSSGTARRCEYLVTNHRLTTHDAHGMSTAIDWFSGSMVDSSGSLIKTSLKSTDLIYGWKEALVLIAMLASLGMVLAVGYLLSNFKFFAPCAAGVAPNPLYEKHGWKWWKGALITILLGGMTYPFCTQLGHGLFPLPDTTVFRMTIGNGFLVWYLILIVFMLGFIFVPFFIKRRKDKNHEIDLLQAGLSRSAPEEIAAPPAEEAEPQEKKHHRVCKIDWPLIGKSAFMAFAMVLPMYLLTVIFEAAFNLDLRFIWPFFKGFSWERLGQFFLYLPMFALFYVLNNSAILAKNRTKWTSTPGAVGFLNTFWRVALSMVGGVLLITLIEYIPFFMGFGPGADLLFSSTFGGPFMSLLIVFVPQVIVFSLIATVLYRKTGNVYVGAFVIAILACWIVCGGSAIL